LSGAPKQREKGLSFGSDPDHDASNGIVGKKIIF